jgi:hypothetical protein
MNPTLPFWFAQRQGKAEPKGSDTYQLSAPNLPPASIGIKRTGDGRWTAFLSLTPDGPPGIASENSFERPEEAWEAAFELYRQHVVL